MVELAPSYEMGKTRLDRPTQTPFCVCFCNWPDPRKEGFQMETLGSDRQSHESGQTQGLQALQAHQEETMVLRERIYS